MRPYDAVVVGAGPAGSVAALVLARGGATVALVDKAEFPRDKACGDLIGPRGVRTLDDLGVLPRGARVGDMDVVGPNGRRVRLRAFAGRTYPGFGLAVLRRELDRGLRDAALAAGAVGITGRAGEPLWAADGGLAGFRLDGTGAEVRGEVVIGADGALSRVAQAAGLVDDQRVLWGFAMRAYTARSPVLPEILFWEPERWRGYPGYGWVFPGPDGVANLGVGVGVVGDRRAAARAARDLPAFAGSQGVAGLEGRLGGWLKMGMVGTVPARGRTLLVGDAAGLVNPLQGEGIAQAVGSARAAADAVLRAGPTGAAAEYRAALARRYAGYAAATAPITARMLAHPGVVAAAGRLLTAPGVGRLVAGGWSVFWNDLLDGAVPGWPRRAARAADVAARRLTARLPEHRAVWASLA